MTFLSSVFGLIFAVT